MLEVLAENPDVHPALRDGARRTRRARPRGDPRGHRGRARRPRLNRRVPGTRLPHRLGRKLEAVSRHPFRHRRRRPHADRQVPGRLRRIERGRAGGARDPGRRRARGHRAASRSTTRSWATSCRPAPGQITSLQAVDRRRPPQGRPGDHDEQGLPVRDVGDRDGRSDDPGRRDRGRGRRRHGVDDERAVRAARRLAKGRDSATRRLLDSMIHDGLWCAVRRPPHGRGHRRDERRARSSRARSRTRGRRGRISARARRVGDRPAGRGGRRRRGPAARRATRAIVRSGRRDPARHDRRGAGEAQARVPARRHHHRGQRVADLRRRLRRSS